MGSSCSPIHVLPYFRLGHMCDPLEKYEFVRLSASSRLKRPEDYGSVMVTRLGPSEESSQPKRSGDEFANMLSNFYAFLYLTHA
ncbi:hypothetical protein FQN57_006581 [Myotisia sp. PD_48]|nr:hypothetical protein FQN57_006581 [Myotisia sp. PD_48]